MKRLCTLIVAILFINLCNNSYAQRWKQYSDSATTYYGKSNSPKAIEYFIKARDELEKDSAATYTYARISNNLALSYLQALQKENAEPYFVEAKNIYEKIVGKKHPDYISICINLSGLYEEIKQYERSEDISIEAKELVEEVFGKKHLDYMYVCNNLGKLYTEMFKYTEAEELLIEAKNVADKLPGTGSDAYDVIYFNLGYLYELAGQYQKSESYYLKVNQIREKIYSKEHIKYSEICYRLSILYRNKGEYNRAEPFAIKSREISGKINGRKSVDYAGSCDNLAGLYYKMNQYGAAEPLFLEAKKIGAEILGREHPYYASSCNNLAVFYHNLGQYEKAELLYLESIHISEKIRNYEYSYSRYKMNLANLYVNMSQRKKAEPLYIEVMRTYEGMGLKEHPDYATVCNGLANLYVETGQYGKAETLYIETKKLVEKVLGKNHPDYAGTCNNLAILYLEMDQYTKARPLYIEAEEIRKKVLGKDHPDYAESCNNLAGLFWRMKQYEKAGEYFSEWLQLRQTHIKKIFQFTSEAEKQSYLKNGISNNSGFFSFNYQEHLKDRKGDLYDVSLTNRNSILSSLQKLRHTIYNSSDTSINSKYNNWINSREQISFWYTKLITDRPAYVKDLEEQANNLEKELIHLSADFKKDQLNNRVTWKSIQQSLKTNEASIEFVEFKYFDSKRWTDSTFYIALVLRKDKPEPEFVKLFEKKQLDTLFGLTENMAADTRINTLYNENKSLYNLTWKPLEKYLSGITKIYFASAGNLCKISFAALPVNDKQVLGGKYQIIQLNTTATVTENTQSFLTAADRIQLYGGIMYDADSMSLKKAIYSQRSTSTPSVSLPTDLERGEIFKYLPGTQQETEEIKKQAGSINTLVTVQSGINATEESVKALTGKKSPSVLHIATHGFFFPDPKDDKRDEIQRKFESSGKAFKQSDNPLFRSGLLFAGANNAWQGKPIDGIEDGILTAYEVSNMYLPNTKLVVLSACETALGDIQGSEGVYGLQRAFKMAGVQNLVMSLWKVPDAETAEFMQLFYKNLFARQTISNAFYNAQQVMKNKYRTEPYKWAAWVLVR